MLEHFPPFIFFGTDAVAVSALQELSGRGVVPDLIVSTPDRRAGRKNTLRSPPVKVWASKEGLKCVQPEKLKGYAELSDHGYALGLVVSYGKIVPSSVIDSFEEGILNIHPSLLPTLRGASPIKSAILDGLSKTGVSVMRLDQEMDHGPILIQSTIDLSPQEATAGELQDKLLSVGVELLLKAAPAYMSGEAKLQEQDHSAATFSKKFTKDDAYINPAAILTGEDVKIAYAKIRALSDKPGTWTTIKTLTKEIRLRVLEAKLDGGKLVPLSVIPEGKKEMTWDAFLRGNKVTT